MLQPTRVGAPNSSGTGSRWASQHRTSRAAELVSLAHDGGSVLIEAHDLTYHGVFVSGPTGRRRGLLVAGAGPARDSSEGNDCRVFAPLGYCSACSQHTAGSYRGPTTRLRYRAGPLRSNARPGVGPAPGCLDDMRAPFSTST